MSEARNLALLTLAEPRCETACDAGLLDEAERMTTGWALPPERTGAAPSEALIQSRKAVARRPRSHPPRPDLSETWLDVNGVRCLEIAPPAFRRTVLYLHGGGFRLGGCEAWSGFAGLVAARLSARMVLPEYRLAPEAPFPAALKDAAAVLGSLSEDGADVVVAGDSAGGGLAAATALAGASIGLPRPAALVLLSPWLDLTLSGETFERNADQDRFFPRREAEAAVRLYLQGHPPSDPLVSPLFGDLAGLPPCLVLAGGSETLLADATRFADRLARAGTSIELHVHANMQHVWPIISPELPESRAAIETIIRFCDQVMVGANPPTRAST